MSKTAHILAVDAARLPSTGSGFFPIGEALTLDRLEKAGLFLGSRPMLEEDERFRQIIPYVVVRQGPDFLGYVRGTDGGEARLHGKISIGAGGHIDMADVELAEDGSVDLRETLHKAAYREMTEELCFTRRDGPLGYRQVAAPEVKWLGLLIDDADPVGRVHIGIVGVADCESEIEAQESCISQLDSFTVEQLRQDQDRLEGWSALLLPSLQSLLDT